MNTHWERFFGSLKSKWLHRRTLFGEKAARNAILQSLDHYHMDRCHQGLDNGSIVPLERPPYESVDILSDFLDNLWYGVNKLLTKHFRHLYQHLVIEQFLPFHR